MGTVSPSYIWVLHPTAGGKQYFWSQLGIHRCSELTVYCSSLFHNMGLEHQRVLISVGGSSNHCLPQIPRNSWVLGESKIICRFPATPFTSLPCLRVSCILKFKLLLSRLSDCNMVKFFKYVFSLSREVCRYVFYILLWKQKMIRIQ